jgi:hypothetical protein
VNNFESFYHTKSTSLLKAHAIKLIKLTFNGEVYILAEKTFNIVGNVLSQILSHLTQNHANSTES